MKEDEEEAAGNRLMKTECGSAITQPLDFFSELRRAVLKNTEGGGKYGDKENRRQMSGEDTKG